MKYHGSGQFPALLALLFLPAPALAHGGHLGELAGHSHWIGWGALVAGAALAALLGRKPKKENAVAEDESAPDAEEEVSGEEQSA